MSIRGFFIFHEEINRNSEAHKNWKNLYELQNLLRAVCEFNGL